MADEQINRLQKELDELTEQVHAQQQKIASLQSRILKLGNTETVKQNG